MISLNGKYAYVAGKKILVKNYFKVIANQLPKILDKNNEPLNHYSNLLSAYREKGIDGFNDYIELCKTVTYQGIRKKEGYFKFLYLKIKGFLKDIIKMQK